jgi:hypothetical protein
MWALRQQEAYYSISKMKKAGDNANVALLQCAMRQDAQKRNKVVLILPLCALVCMVTDLAAQEAPAYPSPPTRQSCEEFKVRHIQYLEALRDKQHQCYLQHQNDPGFYRSENQTSIQCHPVRVPRACAGDIEKSACAHSYSGNEQISRCFQEARDEFSDPVRKAMLDSVSDQPSSNIKGALRLARTYADLKKK